MRTNIKYILSIIITALLITGCTVNPSASNNDAEKLTKDLSLMVNENKELYLKVEKLEAENKILKENLEEFKALQKESVNSESIIDSMVGVWHLAPCIPATYSDKYHFFDDGTFIFTNSRSTGVNRDISMKGTWKLDNNLLHLTISSKIVLRDGDYVKDEINSGGYGLINTTTETINFETPLEVIYPLSNYVKWTAENQMPTEMKIGGISYFNLSVDPNTYLD